MRRLSTRAAGLLILILGLWGGLVPFVGPYFHFALGPNHSWTWTSGRFWLSVLPAVVAVIGGLMLLGAGPRPSGKLGALLALAAGIWFAIGPDVSLLWNSSGAVGTAHGAKFIRVLELLTYHTLLGAAIAAIAGYALPGLVTRRAAAEAAGDGYDHSAPLVAETEAGAADRYAVRGGHGTTAVEREPVAAEREPVAAAEREPVAAAEREPVAAERVPVAAAEREPVAPAAREPVTAERELRSESRSVGGRQGDAASPTAVMDHPATAQTEAADGTAAATDSAETVTMRRRRGGLLSRLRN